MSLPLPVLKYCEANDWTEPQHIDNHWWAFPPGAVMAVEIPRSALEAHPEVSLYYQSTNTDTSKNAYDIYQSVFVDHSEFFRELLWIKRAEHYAFVSIGDFCYHGGPFLKIDPNSALHDYSVALPRPIPRWKRLIPYLYPRPRILRFRPCRYRDSNSGEVLLWQRIE